MISMERGTLSQRLRRIDMSCVYGMLLFLEFILLVWRFPNVKMALYALLDGRLGWDYNACRSR